MKLVLAVHGFPPEGVGGTERGAAALAELLAGAGHEVVVVAGSWLQPLAGEVARREETTAAGVRVVRLTRPDLHFDHWHKSKSAAIAAAWRELLQRERPAVVHVLHWLRLSRDLVQIAAQEGFPAIVSLNDSFVSCPLVFRVEPAGGTVCTKDHGPLACVPCAGRVAPRTPWVPMEAAFVQLAERAQDLTRELSLARVVLAPTRTHAERQLRHLGGAAFEFDVCPPAAPAPPPAPRVARASRAGRALVLGAWGELSKLKGTELLFQALDGLADVELRLAGPEREAGLFARLQLEHPGVRATWSGLYDAAELGSLDVSDVHAFVSASRAPESFGLVLDEARALGLPALLPDAGAFAERGGEERGAALYAIGDADALRAAVERLQRDAAWLGALRAAVPAPTEPGAVLAGHLAAYERARSAGAPGNPPAREWYAERMTDFAEQEWDRRCAEQDPETLGLDAPDAPRP